MKTQCRETKTLYREIVGEIASALITLNGKTTTLEVKEALRNRGFWAVQEQVREYMLDITSNDGKIQYRDSGLGYREYTFVNTDWNDDEDDWDDDFYNDSDSILSYGTDVTPISFSHNKLPIDNADGAEYGEHVFTANGTCKYCGNSYNAVTGFDWKDCSKRLVAPPKTGDYLVADVFGRFPRKYRNVTRGQAKHRWAKDTFNHIFAARTRKLV